MKVDFSGRTAIVTGAGRGLGRQYAIDLAVRGAQVVVNDVAGAQGEVDVADEVVDTIRSAGGKAVSSTHSIVTPEGADAIVRTAIDAFGTVDILVNNAGITARKPFVETEAKDMSDLFAVHVLGSFNCARAVWPIMVRKGYGRIVNTTSGSAFGNRGHISYSTAKAAIIGFTRALALDGEDDGILVNAIAPIAATRMTEMFDQKLREAMTPEWPAALIGWLCSEQMRSTGLIISSGLGYIARITMVEDDGVVLPEGACTPEDVAAQWGQIVEMPNPREYSSAIDFMKRALPRIVAQRTAADAGD